MLTGLTASFCSFVPTVDLETADLNYTVCTAYMVSISLDFLVMTIRTDMTIPYAMDFATCG